MSVSGVLFFVGVCVCVFDLLILLPPLQGRDGRLWGVEKGTPRWGATSLSL